MTDRVPIFVELCAGTAALSLRLEHPRARPPVSRMGAKTGYADVILRCMGLRPGQGADRYLWCEPDAGVRLLLHAYRDRELATAAADIIRGWADEEPRALWERLRAEGPAVCPPVDAREVARWLFGSAASYDPSKPWSGFLHPEIGGRYGASRADVARKTGQLPTLPATIADDARKVDPREVARWQVVVGSMWVHKQDGRPLSGWAWCDDKPKPPEHAERLATLATLPATIADDARKIDPREVARYALLGWQSYRQGFPESGFRATAGGAWPDRPPEGETVAKRLDALPGQPATIADDARTVPTPPRLPAGTVAYADVPYQGTTGYAHTFPREEWVPVVRRWQAAGAMVVVSEAEPIPELMAEGWHAVRIDGERKGQKRTFSKQQAEWLTMSEPPRWRPSVQMGLWSRGSV